MVSFTVIACLIEICFKIDAFNDFGLINISLICIPLSFIWPLHYKMKFHENIIGIHASIWGLPIIKRYRIDEISKFKIVPEIIDGSNFLKIYFMSFEENGNKCRFATGRYSFQQCKDIEKAVLDVQSRCRIIKEAGGFP
jgi:hypothetical protein